MIMEESTPVWIVTWEETEGGWGYTSFEDEVYLDEKSADKRLSQLQRTVPEYSGYYYLIKEGTLIQ
jgi:hypothetical protein